MSGGRRSRRSRSKEWEQRFIGVGTKEQWSRRQLFDILQINNSLYSSQILLIYSVTLCSNTFGCAHSCSRLLHHWWYMSLTYVGWTPIIIISFRNIRRTENVWQNNRLEHFNFQWFLNWMSVLGRKSFHIIHIQLYDLSKIL